MLQSTKPHWPGFIFSLNLQSHLFTDWYISTWALSKIHSTLNSTYQNWSHILFPWNCCCTCAPHPRTARLSLGDHVWGLSICFGSFFSPHLETKHGQYELLNLSVLPSFPDQSPRFKLCLFSALSFIHSWAFGVYNSIREPTVGFLHNSVYKHTLISPSYLQFPGPHSLCFSPPPPTHTQNRTHNKIFLL